MTAPTGNIYEDAEPIQYPACHYVTTKFTSSRLDPERLRYLNSTSYNHVGASANTLEPYRWRGEA